jgi:hypothetical protein
MHKPSRFRWIAGALALAAATAAHAQGEKRSVQADVYDHQGTKSIGSLYTIHQGQVELALGGPVRFYPTTDFTLIVFDDRYTNFDSDRRATEAAAPHSVILKDGRVIQASVVGYFVGGPCILMVGNQRQTVNYADVARIYFDPKSFFAAPGPEQPVALKGGEAYIELRNGKTVVERIEDIRGGKERYYALADGRRIAMDEVAFINFEVRGAGAEGDRRELARSGATFFLKSGRIVAGAVTDMLGSDTYVLADGTKIPVREIARIYFR